MLLLLIIVLSGVSARELSHPPLAHLVQGQGEAGGEEGEDYEVGEKDNMSETDLNVQRLLRYFKARSGRLISGISSFMHLEKILTLIYTEVIF